MEFSEGVIPIGIVTQVMEHCSRDNGVEAFRLELQVAKIGMESRYAHGPRRTHAVEGATADEMETHIAEAKEEIGAAGPFFIVERRTPATFTVSGSRVSFRGGHFAGKQGRDLIGQSFTLGDQADCDPY